jgi:hypothetical protein
VASCVPADRTRTAGALTIRNGTFLAKQGVENNGHVVLLYTVGVMAAPYQSRPQIRMVLAVPWFSLKEKFLWREPFGLAFTRDEDDGSAGLARYCS